MLNPIQQFVSKSLKGHNTYAVYARVYAADSGAPLGQALIHHATGKDARKRSAALADELNQVLEHFSDDYARS